jgi:hypothetical protein
MGNECINAFAFVLVPLYYIINFYHVRIGDSNPCTVVPPEPLNINRIANCYATTLTEVENGFLFI